MNRVFAKVSLIVVMCFALPSAARAITLETAGTPSPGPFQVWLDRAPVPTPDVTIDLRFSPCQSIGGFTLVACADPVSRIIWLARGRWDQHNLFHEVFHVYLPLMTPAEQDELARTGLGEERLAEAYSLCARRPIIRHAVSSGYGYVATPKRQHKLCSIFRSFYQSSLAPVTPV